MPHSGGGGSHSGGSSSSSSSHSGGGGSHSGGSSTKVSSTPFKGCYTYAVYDKYGNSKLVYTNTGSYSEEVSLPATIFQMIFGGFFFIPGVIELISIIVILASFIHTGIYKTPYPMYVNKEICIYDEFDKVSDNEEAELKEYLEIFRDKTGIIPAVEFTEDTYWQMDYTDMESFAYNEYVSHFNDENHLLVVYSYGYVNNKTGFNEFNWHTMWGDDLGKTAAGSDEDYLANALQVEFSKGNGKNVPVAIKTALNKLLDMLDRPGIRVDKEKLTIVLFLLIHGGVFFGVGCLLEVNALKEYLKGRKKGLKTFKVKGEPKIRKCEYCDCTYYEGTIGKCPNCGAPLIMY